MLSQCSPLFIDRVSGGLFPQPLPPIQVLFNFSWCCCCNRCDNHANFSRTNIYVCDYSNEKKNCTDTMFSFLYSPVNIDYFPSQQSKCLMEMCWKQVEWSGFRLALLHIFQQCQALSVHFVGRACCSEVERNKYKIPFSVSNRHNRLMPFRMADSNASHSPFLIVGIINVWTSKSGAAHETRWFDENVVPVLLENQQDFRIIHFGKILFENGYLSVCMNWNINPQTP